MAKARRRPDHAGAQGEDIGVVVLTGHPGHVFVGAERGPDPLELVGGDGNAEAGAADDECQSRLCLQRLPATTAWP